MAEYNAVIPDGNRLLQFPEGIIDFCNRLILPHQVSGLYEESHYAAGGTDRMVGER